MITMTTPSSRGAGGRNLCSAAKWFESRIEEVTRGERRCFGSFDVVFKIAKTVAAGGEVKPGHEGWIFAGVTGICRADDRA